MPPMQFRDIAEYFDGSLELPIAGKTYTIPPLSARTGLWAQHLMEVVQRQKAHEVVTAAGGDPADLELTEDDVDQLRMDDDEEWNFNKRMLSPEVFDEMLADDVAWPHLQRAAQTAFLYFTQGETAALKRWEDVEGKAMPSTTPARAGSSRAATSTKTASRSGSRSPRTSAARRATR